MILTDTLILLMEKMLKLFRMKTMRILQKKKRKNTKILKLIVSFLQEKKKRDFIIIFLYKNLIKHSDE